MVMILLMLYLVLWVPYIVMAKGDQVAAKNRKFFLVLFIILVHTMISKVRQQWHPYPMEVYRNLTHSYYEVKFQNLEYSNDSPFFVVLSTTLEI